MTRWITRIGVGALLGAAAVVRSMAAVGQAQTFQTQPTQPDPASLNEAQKASLRHLNELLAVVNTGGSATLVSYLEANTVREPVPSPPGTEARTVEEMVRMTGLASDHRGFDLVRVTTGREGAPSRTGCESWRSRTLGHTFTVNCRSGASPRPLGGFCR